MLHPNSHGVVRHFFFEKNTLVSICAAGCLQAPFNGFLKHCLCTTSSPVANTPTFSRGVTSIRKSRNAAEWHLLYANYKSECVLKSELCPFLMVAMHTAPRKCFCNAIYLADNAPLVFPSHSHKEAENVGMTMHW